MTDTKRTRSTARYSDLAQEGQERASADNELRQRIERLEQEVKALRGVVIALGIHVHDDLTDSDQANIASLILLDTAAPDAGRADDGRRREQDKT